MEGLSGAGGRVMRLLTLFCLGEFMAQYDGVIKIVTKIATKDATESLASLEWQIKKSAKYIEELRSKMDFLKDQKIPTKEYEDLQDNLSKAEKELSELISQQDEWAKLGITSGGAWDSLNEKVASASDNVDAIKEKMQSLVDSGKAFTLGQDTEQYAAYARQIEYEEQAIIKAGEHYKKLQNDLVAGEQRLAEIKDNAVVGNQRIVEVLERRKQLLKEIADMEAAGVGAGYQQYDSAKQELAQLNEEIKEYNNGIGEAKENYKKLGDTAKKSLDKIGNILKKANSYVGSFARGIKEIVQKHFPLFRKETEKTGASVSAFGSRIKSIFSGIFIFNAISAAVRKALSGIREGFENFYNTSNSFKASVDGMRSSLAQLKNALAGAFAPIVETAIPYIQRLIDYINKAVSGIAQLIAALFGKKTYKKAKQVSIGGGTTDTGKDKKKVEQVENSVNDLKDSAEDAEDAMNKMLSPLDKLNNLSSEKKEIEVDTGNIGDVGGDIADDITDGIGEGLEDIFEEIPIDKFWSDIADKVKDVFSKLFTPLKEAWNREGEFVMDSWKYALDEVWKLIKDVGRDFLIMWQQEATIKIFEDILHIIGDIGLAVGNLAQNFRAAWNENSVGLHIFENIRDIIGIIIGHIRNMADATVEWAQNIDFYPLLSAFNGFLESLKPVVDSISGILEDFYTKVLLPLGKWVLEKGLPELLQVFTDFNNKVDWESLRANLAEFWEHLEPFAETVGEGLIIFIRDVSDAIAEFVNSETFQNFLEWLEEKMDSVTAEDVAGALENLATALVLFNAATLGLSAIAGISGVLTTITKFLSFFGAGGAGAGTATTIGGVSAALGGLGTALGDLAAIGAGFATGSAIDDWLVDSGALDFMDETGEKAKIYSKYYEGWGGKVRLLKDDFGYLANVMQGLPAAIGIPEQGFAALEKAMDAVRQGTIYTDAQMEKMRTTWQLSDEDMEMLRQEMLDANPILREMADTFGLYDATPETLYDIAQGLADVQQRGSGLPSTFGGMTEAAQEFFSQNTISGMDDFATKLKDVATEADNASTTLNGIAEDIGEGINKGMAEADTDGASKGFFSELWASIKATFGIASPAKEMMPLGEYIGLGILEGISIGLEQITEALQGFMDKVTPFFTVEKWSEIFDNVKTAVTTKFTEISTTATTIFNSIKTVITDIWNNIQAVTSTVWNGIKTCLSTAVNAVKTTISNVLNGIKANWTSAFNSLKTTATSVFDSIKSKISSVVDWIKQKVASIKNIGSSIAGAVSGVAGISTNFYSMRGTSAAVSLASLANAEIPGYATGQVIPRTMKQHLAILGDNNRETEVVSPLSTIKQANKESLLEVLTELGLTSGRNGNNGGGSVTIEIPVTISGIGEIGRAVQQFDMEFFKQNGRHAFT